MSKIELNEPEIIQLPKFLDARGNLSFVENFKQIPFEIKRTYWLYDVPGGECRGGHAYRENEEFIIALSGAFDVIVDDNICKDANGNVYPLFGRAKKTVAGGIQDDFELQDGKPVGSFDTHYWGKGVFGVKAPLSYLLVTAKLNTNFSV